MEDFIGLLVQWTGVILSVILAIIIILSANAGGTTKAEKQLDRDDNDRHYLVSNSMGSFFTGLLIVIIGAGVCVFIGWLASDAASDTKKLIVIAAEAVIAIITAVIFAIMARKSLCERVLVDGDRIEVYPSFGKSQRTTFAEIRTVKKNGGETAKESTSLVIRPNGGSRFTVKKSMKNFDRFARQIDSDVALPNLTKKQKKKAKSWEDELDED